MPKIILADLKKAVFAYSRTRSQVEIAKLLGIHRNTVRSILKNEPRWLSQRKKARNFAKKVTAAVRFLRKRPELREYRCKKRSISVLEICRRAGVKTPRRVAKLVRGVDLTRPKPVIKRPEMGSFDEAANARRVNAFYNFMASQ